MSRNHSEHTAALKTLEISFVTHLYVGDKDIDYSLDFHRAKWILPEYYVRQKFFKTLEKVILNSENSHLLYNVGINRLCEY